jgi:phosphoadenosine phosphosulfate reductase
MTVTAPAAQQKARELGARFGALDGASLLEPMIRSEFAGRIALVSSLGTESALLLDLVARIDRSVPVLFLDTGKLFGETLRYRDELVRRLGLCDVRTIAPERDDVAWRDPDGMLWRRDPGACCALRKVEPLARALQGFEAWISGRKRYQAASREELPSIEAAAGMIKINPLATWSRERIRDEFARRGLPPHPLEEDGFSSIGCMPCTDRTLPGEDARAGRWRGLGKTECGIHRDATAEHKAPSQ